MNIRILRRNSPPGKFDCVDIYTLCQTGEDFNTAEFYIQISPNPDIPEWHHLGSISTTMLIDIIDILLKVRK